MKTGKLKHAVTLERCWDHTITGIAYPGTFLKGTDVHQVQHGWGAQWAITSEKLVADTTGNVHDAMHRHVWIDAQHVEETP